MPFVQTRVSSQFYSPFRVHPGRCNKRQSVFDIFFFRRLDKVYIYISFSTKEWNEIIVLSFVQYRRVTSAQCSVKMISFIPEILLPIDARSRRKWFGMSLFERWNENLELLFLSRIVSIAKYSYPFLKIIISETRIWIFLLEMGNWNFLGGKASRIPVFLPGICKISYTSYIKSVGNCVESNQFYLSG